MSKCRQRYGIALLDKNNKILVVFENSFPIKFRKWGFVKGHKEVSDKNNFDCMTRELYEEVGLVLNSFTYEILSLLKNGIYLIKVDKSCDEIKLSLGNEIKQAKWLELKNLYEKCDKDPHLFNLSIRNTLHQICNNFFKKIENINN